MNNIPEKFLTIAAKENIPGAYAVNFFLRKSHKKGCDDIAYNLIKEGYFENEVEARKALANAWKEYMREGVAYNENSSYVSKAVKIDQVTYLDQARAGLEKTIGSLNYPKFDNSKKILKNRKIVISDLHGLWCDEKAFATVLQDPAEEVIVLGDLLDCYAASKYSQTIDHITMREELASGRAKMEALAKSFKKVHCLSGNHDKRPLKRIQELVPQILPLLVDPLELLAAGLTNVNFLSHTVPNTAPNSTYGEDYKMDFCGMIGDALFGHFENFCSPSATVQLNDWLDTWESIIKLSQEPKIIFQGHSHSLNMNFTHEGRLLVNTGCLCRPQHYKMDSHGKYRPDVVGYVIFYQDEKGITDVNKTEMIYLGNL